MNEETARTVRHESPDPENPGTPPDTSERFAAAVAAHAGPRRRTFGTHQTSVVAHTAPALPPSLVDLHTADLRVTGNPHADDAESAECHNHVRNLGTSVGALLHSDPDDDEVSLTESRTATRVHEELHDDETPTLFAKESAPQTPVGRTPQSPARPTLSAPLSPTFRAVAMDALLISTEALYAQVRNAQDVTVKDIVLSLQAEYGGLVLTKLQKKAVREHLTTLIQQQQQQQPPDTESDGDDRDDEKEEEEDSVGEVDSSDDEVDESSDYEEDQKPNHSKEWKRRVPVTPKQHSTDTSHAKSSRSSSLRKKKVNPKTSAVRKHAEKLRQRRMQELRVRNEELQLEEDQRSAQDQERAVQIAQKFDTNTDELKLLRVQHRLDLLQKLDQTRVRVLQTSNTLVTTTAPRTGDVHETTVAEDSTTPVGSETDKDDSDEDSELEIVGASETSPKLWKHPPPRPTNDLLGDLLNRADDANNAMHPPLRTRKPAASPGSARAALKVRLVAQRRRMGNLWLARELGYSNEKEHLDECLALERQKQKAVLQREQVRLVANERQALRATLLREQATSEAIEDGEQDDSDDEAYIPENDTLTGGLPSFREESENEEDEEQVMAREIEFEQAPAVPPALSSPPVELARSVTASTDIGDTAESEDKDNALSEIPIGPVQTDIVSDEETNRQEDDLVDSEDDFETQGRSSLVYKSAAPNAEEKSAEARILALSGAQVESDSTSNVTEEQDETIQAKAASPEKPKGPRNSAWQALLRKEAEQLKKSKRNKNGLVEEEADEEEEEEIVGLEDFGFKLHKRSKQEEDEDDGNDEVDEEDLKHVVDDLSDDEGDEDAGKKARIEMQQQEEKERHKEMMRRMRDGLDGRRGGIATGGAGARGMHRFDQLVAADNRESAKRLGLLNDDELDSDNEEGNKDATDDEEDETALLDKMLKDRFLHRSSVQLEENFSDDDSEDDEEQSSLKDGSGEQDELEEKEQERLAKRFAKRARMQRLIETYGHDEEFSQSKLIDEDATLQIELQQMKASLNIERSAKCSHLPLTVSTSFFCRTDWLARGASLQFLEVCHLAIQPASLFRLTIRPAKNKRQEACS
jgi:hypothetical protein